MIRPVVSRHHFPRAEARAAIVSWCQDFYNVKRGHSSQRCWIRTSTRESLPSSRTQLNGGSTIQGKPTPWRRVDSIARAIAATIFFPRR